MSNNPDLWHLIPFNPWIKIFKALTMPLFYFIDPQRYDKFQKNLMDSLWDIQRVTDRQTDQWTNKDDSHGTHQVNTVSKIVLIQKLWIFNESFSSKVMAQKFPQNGIYPFSFKRFALKIRLWWCANFMLN